VESDSHWIAIASEEHRLGLVNQVIVGTYPGIQAYFALTELMPEEALPDGSHTPVFYSVWLRPCSGWSFHREYVGNN
jgi:hypothetical protein